MGEFDQVNKSKKKFLLFCSVLTLLVAVSGVILWCCRASEHHEKAVDTLENFLIDDTLYAREIAVAAEKHGVPPLLIKALIKKESRFDANCRGKAGEIGLMQIIPSASVADWARVNKCAIPSEKELFEPAKNLDIGCWYLAVKLKKWKKYRYGMELALAEYNAGAKNTARWKPETLNGEVRKRIDFPLTRKYVTEIMHDYREYLIESKQ